MKGTLLFGWALLGAPIAVLLLGRAAVLAYAKGQSSSSPAFFVFLPAAVAFVATAIWAFFSAVRAKSLPSRVIVTVLYALGMSFVLLTLVQFQLWGALGL